MSLCNLYVQIRRRALVIFNDKITNDKDILSPKERGTYIEMVGSLVSILERSGTSSEVSG